MRRLWPALVLVALAVPAAGQDAEIMRPCRRADLIGFWRVVRFGFAAGATVDRGDPAYRTFQRYVFNANATMAYAASDAAPTAEEDRALLLGATRTTWALDPSGHLMRQRDGTARVERSECRVMTRGFRDPRSNVPVLAGDVLLTDQGEDERPITRRLLRKPRRDE